MSNSPLSRVADTGHTSYPRFVPTVIVLSGVALTVYVAVRNEPFRDPFMQNVIRVFLAFAAGVMANQLPGFFGLHLQTAGRTLSAAGAAGVALTVFFAMPVVAPSLSPNNVQQIPPKTFLCKVWTILEYQMAISAAREHRLSLESQRAEWFYHLLRMHDEVPLTNAQVIVAETEAFDEPYFGFTAWVDTVAEPTPLGEGKKGLSHTIYAFLVHKHGTDRTFTPLETIHVEAHRSTLVVVPQSSRDDYILILAILQGEKIPTKGPQIPFNLNVL